MASLPTMSSSFKSRTKRFNGPGPFHLRSDKGTVRTRGSPSQRRKSAGSSRQFFQISADLKSTPPSAVMKADRVLFPTPPAGNTASPTLGNKLSPKSGSVPIYHGRADGSFSSPAANQTSGATVPAVFTFSGLKGRNKHQSPKLETGEHLKVTGSMGNKGGDSKRDAADRPGGCNSSEKPKRKSEESQTSSCAEKMQLARERQEELLVAQHLNEMLLAQELHKENLQELEQFVQGSLLSAQAGEKLAELHQVDSSLMEHWHKNFEKLQALLSTQEFERMIPTVAQIEDPVAAHMEVMLLQHQAAEDLFIVAESRAPPEELQTTVDALLPEGRGSGTGTAASFCSMAKGVSSSITEGDRTHQDYFHSPYEEAMAQRELEEAVFQEQQLELYEVQLLEQCDLQILSNTRDQLETFSQCSRTSGSCSAQSDSAGRHVAYHSEAHSLGDLEAVTCEKINTALALCSLKKEGDSIDRQKRRKTGQMVGECNGGSIQHNTTATGLDEKDPGKVSTTFAFSEQHVEGGKSGMSQHGTIAPVLDDADPRKLSTGSNEVGSTIKPKLGTSFHALTPHGDQPHVENSSAWSTTEQAKCGKGEQDNSIVKARAISHEEVAPRTKLSKKKEKTGSAVPSGDGCMEPSNLEAEKLTVTGTANDGLIQPVGKSLSGRVASPTRSSPGQPHIDATSEESVLEVALATRSIRENGREGSDGNGAASLTGDEVETKFEEGAQLPVTTAEAVAVAAGIGQGASVQQLQLEVHAMAAKNIAPTSMVHHQTLSVFDRNLSSTRFVPFMALQLPFLPIKAVVGIDESWRWSKSFALIAMLFTGKGCARALGLMAPEHAQPPPEGLVGACTLADYLRDLVSLGHTPTAVIDVPTTVMLANLFEAMGKRRFLALACTVATEVKEMLQSKSLPVLDRVLGTPVVPKRLPNL